MRGIRKFFIYLFLCCLCLSLIGCGRPDHYSPAQLTNEILDRLNKTDMEVLNEKQLSNYFTFSAATPEDFSVCISKSETSSDEVAAFMIGAASEAELVDSINDHVAKRSAAFQSMSALEYKKLESRLIMKVGNVVVLVVSDNASAVKAALESLGACSVA